ncbi:hypothetical protein D9758_008696 [Tetrapyrgos nigripes]|uniref:Fusaric acid resistance protein n=1 Tax=Tetrapyrgos nigripes TaxID=182062 RepID=A0A8H5D515_9AGAR|nr:hypothetical protein D9758_008696 [Tetrapyrgos nigripes]
MATLEKTSSRDKTSLETDNNKVEHDKATPSLGSSKDSQTPKGASATKETTSSSSPNATANGSTSQNDPSKSLFTKLTSALPPWVTTNLQNPRSLKTWLRCWLAAWVGIVIFLPHKSLNTLGASAFFSMLSAFFLPPNIPVQLFVFMISTMLIGILLGWGVGAAAMRAASAVRSQALLQAATLQLQQSIQSNPALQANPSFAQTDAVFHGLFLDTRSSVMFGAFLGVGVFFFGLIRAYAPKLTILSIFGTIAVDIFCSIGPLFPAPQYNLLRSLLISSTCYCAVGLILTIFVFPESMSHSALRTFSDQLRRAKALIEIQDEVLKSKPEELGRGTVLGMKIEGMRAGLVGVQTQLSTTAGFMSLEFSWGKWNSDDVKDLLDPMSSLIARVAGLQSFSRLVGQTPVIQGKQPDSVDTNTSTNTNTNTNADANPANASSPSQGAQGGLKKALKNDTYLVDQVNKINATLESTYNCRIIDLLPIISKASLHLREACVYGCNCTIKKLENINKHRWTKNPDQDGSLVREMDGSIEKLRGVLNEFRETHRLLVLEPFMPMLQRTFSSEDEEEQEELAISLPLRSLYISYVFCTNLVAVTEALLRLMELMRATVAKRRVNRLWAPKGLRALWKLFTVRGDENDRAALGDETLPKGDETGELEDRLYRRDPDSRAPTNFMQKVMNSTHGLYHWTKTAEAKFTLKFTVASVALWVPAVVHRTAHFYYVERGFWALIMLQTTMNIYAADQIYNLVTRLVGTFVGLCFGLVAWYMGNGLGNGNPYGAAAATGFVMVPMTFIRIFAPIQYLPGVILTCVTTALIVGYSWVDGNLPQYSSPGIGWNIAWKRFTLVVIGSAASFIMMMLPPTSGRKAVRLRNASIISQLADLYGFLISTWISTDSLKEGDSSSDEDLPAADTHVNSRWLAEFRKRLLDIAGAVTATRSLTAIATWEGSIRGKWPVKEYMALLDVEAEMITALAQLGGALTHMDDEWRVQFLHSTRALNPNFITDVMAVFSLISQSLRTAEPLHAVLPQSLVGRLMYHSHSHHHMHARSHSEGTDSKHSSVSLDHVASIDYMFYAAGVVAMFQLLQSLDELHRLTKELCGEVPLRGFTDWRDQFERSHTRV